MGGGDEENVVVVLGGGGGSLFDIVLVVNVGEFLKERSNLGLVMGMVIGIGMMFWR